MFRSVFARHGALVTALYSGVFAVAFATLAVATAMPAAAAQLGQISLYAWAFSLFVMSMMVATVVAGRLADRRGPVIPLVVGMVAFGAGLVLASLSVSMPMLLAARALQGLGGGFLNLSLMVLVAHLFSEAERPVIMTGFSVCWVLPAFVGPPIAAWLTVQFSWRWVFLSVLPLLMLSTALGVRPVLAWQRGFAAPRASSASVVPVWAALVVAVAVAGVQAAGQLLNAPASTTNTLMIVALGGLGVLGIVVGAPRLMPPGFTRLGPGLGSLMWTRGLQAGGFFGAEAFLPLSLVEGRHLSLGAAGAMLTIGSVGWTFGSWLQSRPWLGLRRDQLVVAGATFGALGVGVIAVGTAAPRLPLAVLVVGWVFAGMGMGLATASGSLATMTLSQPGELGRNTSSLQVSEGLGSALIVGLVGSVFAALHDRSSAPVTFGAVFATAAALGAMGVLSSRRIGPVTPVSEPTTAP